MAPKNQLKQTAAAWDQFVRSGHLTQVNVPQAVLASWQNCRDKGVDPWENRRIQAGFVPGEEVEARRISHRRRRPEETLEAVGRFADESRVVLSVYDHQGYFVEALNDRYPERMAAKLGVSSLFLGQLTEELSGTNAVTLAMREAATVRLAGHEHFHSWFHEFSCSAAPLRDATGKITGAVGASSLDVHQPLQVLPFLRCVADLYQHWRWLEYDRNKTRYWQGTALMKPVSPAIDKPHPLNQLVGVSAAMERVRKQVAAVAPGALPVMIVGESGVGKEVVANAIHQLSGRSQGPLVAINCGALSETLAEATLFGYEKGAFTGARGSGKKGLLEAARGGTLFLDEVESLSPSIQAMLLRCLSERKLMPLGGSQEQEVDFRLLTALKTPGEQAVQAGALRADFYYRIDGYTIAIPPLCHRREDIPLLMKIFLKALAEAGGRGVPRFSEEAVSCCCHYRWPGNVRQLKNLMEQLMTTCHTDEITLADLPKALRYSPEWLNRLTSKETLAKDGKKWLHHLEKQMVRQLVAETDGNISEAARRMGVSRPTLYRILQEAEDDLEG